MFKDNQHDMFDQFLAKIVDAWLGLEGIFSAVWSWSFMQSDLDHSFTKRIYLVYICEMVITEAMYKPIESKYIWTVWGGKGVYCISDT